MERRIRWGILGTGAIARLFADGLMACPGAELAAVGSRTQKSADAFGDHYRVARRHASYEALANDPNVDVIYIATPHTLHAENSILCIEAGKAVLCEKPFTINAGETERVIQAARAKKVFLMEAMWTRFIPAMRQAHEWVAEGKIGRVRMVQASFGFYSEPDEEGRLLNPALGGGSLLDVGIYPVALAYDFFRRPPARITGFADMKRFGVDEQAAMLFNYDDGGLAVLSSGVTIETPYDAWIMGETGQIQIHAPFWSSPRATLRERGKYDVVADLPLVGNGYNYEAEEVMRCMREGKLESELMPLDETLTIMRTMDEIRAQWGLKYAADA